MRNLLIGLVLFFAAQAFAATWTMEGVVSVRGVPVYGAVVTATYQSSLVATAESDSAGYYILTMPLFTPTTGSITVSYPGYAFEAIDRNNGENDVGPCPILCGNPYANLNWPMDFRAIMPPVAKHHITKSSGCSQYGSGRKNAVPLLLFAAAGLARKRRKVYNEVATQDGWTLVCDFHNIGGVTLIGIPDMLRNKIYEEVWKLQDGYGTPGFMPPQGWDWSGIRDSSAEAKDQMGNKIRWMLDEAGIKQYAVMKPA